eukprot:6473584-Amphidinium_carterae.1
MVDNNIISLKRFAPVVVEAFWAIILCSTKQRATALLLASSGRLSSAFSQIAIGHTLCYQSTWTFIPGAKSVGKPAS